LASSHDLANRYQVASHIHRSVRPKGAKGDSPGQSEAPPWVRLRDGSIGLPW
jgi:hypothetical protein